MVRLHPEVISILPVQNGQITSWPRKTVRLDRCWMNCFHARNHAHTCHHVHILLYTILLLCLLQIVVQMCIYTFTIACMYSLHARSCIHCMFSVHASKNICASSTTTDRLMFHELFHASSHAHTRHHVHRALYTIMYLFYDKRVVHMCIYTSNIAFMHSLHACSCIYSMFSVHASTNICASSTSTDRLMFHELFPCKYSCTYSSSCAPNIVHSNVFLL